MFALASRQAHDWREGRRLRAWGLKEQGWPQQRIAEALGVSESAVSQWCKRARTAGPEGLRHRPPPGAPPRRRPEQRAHIPELLQRSPTQYGCQGEVWTGKRVAVLLSSAKRTRDRAPSRSAAKTSDPATPSTGSESRADGVSLQLLLQRAVAHIPDATPSGQRRLRVLRTGRRIGSAAWRPGWSRSTGPPGSQYVRLAAWAAGALLGSAGLPGPAGRPARARSGRRPTHPRTRLLCPTLSLSLTGFPAPGGTSPGVARRSRSRGPRADRASCWGRRPPGVGPSGGQSRARPPGACRAHASRPVPRPGRHGPRALREYGAREAWPVLTLNSADRHQGDHTCASDQSRRRGRSG